jgi:hypothetical protein
MKGALLAGSVAVAIAAGTVVVLTAALARIVDPHNYCGTGFSSLIECKAQWLSRTISQSTPIFAAPEGAESASASRSRDTLQPGYFEATSWAVADCPRNVIARRLLCADPSVAAPAQAASDDLATGLPRPRPWVVTAAKKTPFMESVHVETPLALATTLDFYRAELKKRGWTENDGARVEPDRAAIAFTTSDGPALLQLTRQDDKTIVDLSLREPGAANAGLLSKPGRVKLRLGNATEEEAVITINAQTIHLAARAGLHLEGEAETGAESNGSPEIDLPPGKFKVTLKLASGAAQSRQFEVAADETWGLLIGPNAVALPVHLY